MNSRAPRDTSTARTTAPSVGGDDRELVARMSAGDETALAQFYDRWAWAIHAFVAHLVRDGDDAEDILEDTFWQAWRQASRYEAARGQVGTWLLTIARSRALDRLRARRRLREEPLTPVLLGDADAINVAGGEDPRRRTEMLERRALVANALRALSPEQRQALELAFFAGLSQTDIADRTGQPVAAIKTRTRLAAETLRDRLEALRRVDGASGPA